MITLTHPAFTSGPLTHRATTESFVAATIAVVTLLVALVSLLTGISAATTQPGGSVPMPSPQAQIAPRPVHQAGPST